MKIEKNLYLIAYLSAASCLFAGCGKEMPEPADQGAIGFNIQAVSRGSIQNTDNLSGFGVFTYYHATGGFDNTVSTPDYMYNTAIQKNGTEWIYTPVKYWPTNGSLSFFAYSPHTADTEGSLTISGQSNPGLPVLTYTVPDDVTKQLDLLAAAPVYASTDRSNKVHFDFEHALARITFDAKLAAALPTGWSANITNIQIGETKNKGAYRFNAWTIAGDAAEKSYLLSIDNGLLKNSALTTSFQTMLADNAHLMLIPQEIDALDVISITVSFDKNGTIENKTFTRPLRDIIPNLEGAKAYNVKLSVNSVMSFDLICNVSNWTTYNITLPPFS